MAAIGCHEGYVVGRSNSHLVGTAHVSAFHQTALFRESTYDLLKVVLGFGLDGTSPGRWLPFRPSWRNHGREVRVGRLGNLGAWGHVWLKQGLNIKASRGYARDKGHGDESQRPREFAKHGWVDEKDRGG